MKPISVLPGRIRWHVPPLLGRPALARDVAVRLQERPDVRRASANALTGNVLTLFAPGTPMAEAESWVVEALERSVEAPAVSPVPAPSRSFDMVRPLSQLAERARPHRQLFRRMLTASFLNRLLDSAPSMLTGIGIDVVTRGRSSVLGLLGLHSMRSQMLGLGGLGLVVWAADAFFDYQHRRSGAELADAVRHDLRNELYQHIQNLDIAQFETRDVGAWINLIESDLSRIHGFVKEGTDPIIAIIANGVTVIGTVLTLSPRFALAQLLLIPPVAIASKKLLGPMRERMAESRRDSERVTALLHANLSSLPTIKSFAAQDAEAARLQRAGEIQMASAGAANELSALYVPTLTMIVGAEFMAAIVYGGLQVERGALTPGAYSVLATTQLRLLASIGYFGHSLERYQRVSVSIGRVLDVLATQPKIRNRPSAVPLETIHRDVLFDDVTFGYEPDRDALRRISLRFPAGRTAGIVGASGAGKSTVLKLALRFYDVQQGAVRYDGVDVRDLRIEDLRSTVAMVSQELTVFAGTVRENICYARPDATDREVRAAAEVAEAHEFIEDLPLGYDTTVGFGGLQLSAGQRQRLAIARVVLANRPILLFDEATSALDYQTEAAVQRHLMDATAGRTTIIVAHRLSTVRRAEVIYVLEDGEVKEQGRHDELIYRDGIYASMWRVQTGESLKQPPPS